MILLLLLFIKSGELCTGRLGVGLLDKGIVGSLFGKCSNMGIMKLPSELREFQSSAFVKGTKKINFFNFWYQIYI